MPETDRPVLCIDFDGCLHAYTSGWKGADVVSDSPVPGAQEFVRLAQKHFKVVVFSARSHQAGGIEAMKRWMARWGFPDGIGFPEGKPPAQVYLDDGAVRFEGTWPKPADLLKLKSWVERLKK